MKGECLMARFECKKCGSLVIIENGAKTAICNVCGKRQTVPAAVIEDKLPVTNNDHDPQWNRYAKLLYQARNYRDIKVLTKTAEEFDKLGDYQNSREMAEFCRKRISEEQTKRNAETEMRKVQDRYKDRARKINMFKMILLAVGVVGLVILITVTTNILTKGPTYNQAQSLMAEGQYEDAIFWLKRINGYKDSEDLIDACQNAIWEAEYQDAIEQMDSGFHTFALLKFEKLNGYKDSNTLILECRYRIATGFMETGNYSSARKEFLDLGEYKDAAALAEEAKSKLSNP